MVTLKDHAAAAICDYCKLNQIPFSDSDSVQPIWEDTSSGKVQQGMYIIFGDTTHVYFIVQHNEFTIPQTNITVFAETNRLVFDSNNN